MKLPWLTPFSSFRVQHATGQFEATLASRRSKACENVRREREDSHRNCLLDTRSNQQRGESVIPHPSTPEDAYSAPLPSRTRSYDHQPGRATIVKKEETVKVP